jgi:hypothetical protein
VGCGRIVASEKEAATIRVNLVERGWTVAQSNNATEPFKRKLYRVGPNCETWPNTLAENP